jgi:hypothetical protein
VAQQETKLFTGDATPSQFSRMDMVSWAMGEIKTDARYVNFGTDAEPAFTRVTANPEKGSIKHHRQRPSIVIVEREKLVARFFNLRLGCPY